MGRGPNSALPTAAGNAPAVAEAERNPVAFPSAGERPRAAEIPPQAPYTAASAPGSTHRPVAPAGGRTALRHPALSAKARNVLRLASPVPADRTRCGSTRPLLAAKAPLWPVTPEPAATADESWSVLLPPAAQRPAGRK